MESTIRERAARVRSLETERRQLREQVREAHAAGVTVAELMAWTGYSRRTLFYILKEQS